VAFTTEDDAGNVVRLLPPAPPPPVLQPAPPAPAPQPAPAAPRPPGPAPAALVNAKGETLAQAKAAVLAEVAAGDSPGQALADHPLPPGSVTANEALDFLASLPQSVTPIGDVGASVVTGPPIDSLPGYDPLTHSVDPTVAQLPGGSSVDVGGTGDGGRSLESAYRPPGVVTQWRGIVDVFKLKVPKTHAAIDSANKALLGVFK
jgi:hypothetical protein